MSYYFSLFLLIVTSLFQAFAEVQILRDATGREYQLIRFVGNGAFGEVYEARSKGEVCVVKIIVRKDLYRGYEYVRRLQESRGRSEHIADVLSIWSEDTNHDGQVERIVVAAKYVPSNLSREASSFRLLYDRDFEDRVRRVENLITQVTEGMAALFAAGLGHGDIKPANILSSGGDKPHYYLSDFDSVKLLDSVSSLGTEGFVPPEYQSTGGILSIERDIYSFSKVIQQLAIGETWIPKSNYQMPTPQTSERERWRAVLEIWRSTIPASEHKRIDPIRDLITAGLEKDPELRIQLFKQSPLIHRALKLSLHRYEPSLGGFFALCSQVKNVISDRLTLRIPPLVVY